MTYKLYNVLVAISLSMLMIDSAKGSLGRCEKKLLVNYVDHSISLCFTDKHHKNVFITVCAGMRKLLDYFPDHIKNVTYFDKYQGKWIAITGAKLQENSVIVFTLDNKLEYFNCVDIREKYDKINKKQIELNQVKSKMPGNRLLIEKIIKDIENIQNQTIYSL